MRADPQVFAVLQQHGRIISIAKLAGALDNGIENRPDIGRRGRDHVEDVAAPGLIGQRLGKIAGLRLHLVEQPGVLDGDRSLVGKSRDQFDLLVGERPRFGARQTNYADRHTVAQHRNAEDGTEAPNRGASIKV